jgi:hypothetical protein
MISFFNSQNDKFAYATGSEIALYQLQKRNQVEELVFEDPKPQNISK